ncbi:MAG: 30S ribosomal protein S4 [Candidatus Yanofskybacteria bacterium]|nr:30S ribosomal protein S4 [Candidatus Yanofskybacteria bacterium]
MARYTGPREKIERRLGTKLFLKGERSYSPKSATVKRMYPPGMHGKSFRNRISEYGSQLQAKQKIRNTYRMMERQFKNWVKDAIKSKQETGDTLIKKLETRLDNVVFRSGLAQSRDQARQLVNHGHIKVNSKKVSIPSCEVKIGDILKVREGSLKTKYFSVSLAQWLKKCEPPKWIELDKDTLTIKIVGLPTIQESGLEVKDIQLLIEFYSR